MPPRTGNLVDSSRERNRSWRRKKVKNTFLSIAIAPVNLEAMMRYGATAVPLPAGPPIGGRHRGTRPGNRRVRVDYG